MSGLYISSVKRDVAHDSAGVTIVAFIIGTASLLITHKSIIMQLVPHGLVLCTCLLLWVTCVHFPIHRWVDEMHVYFRGTNDRYVLTVWLTRIYTTCATLFSQYVMISTLYTYSDYATLDTTTSVSIVSLGVATFIVTTIPMLLYHTLRFYSYKYPLRKRKK